MLKRLTIGGAVTFVILAIFATLIEILTDAALTKWWPPLRRELSDSVEFPYWFLPFLLLLVLVAQIIGFLIFAWLLRRHFAGQIATIRETQDELAALRHAIDLVEMDDSLFRLLPLLASSPNKPAAIEKLLTEFLRDATGIFEGDVSRGMILRAEGDELAAWVGYQMPQATLRRTRFSLNSNQGIALKTFRDGKLRVVHFTRTKKGWKADARDYKVFESNRPHPPYRSFVTVAIKGDASENVGVLCFDSMNGAAFDPPEIQHFLGALAQRAASALLIYNQLERSTGATE